MLGTYVGNAILEQPLWAHVQVQDLSKLGSRDHGKPSCLLTGCHVSVRIGIRNQMTVTFPYFDIKTASHD